MTSPLAIGIDLGTSTSEIAVYRNGAAQVIDDPSARVPIIPSLVAVDNKGTLLVGHQAESRVDISGVREIKRQMGTGSTVDLGGKDYLPQEISSYILNKLKRQAEEALGQEITSVVLTVPANFPDAARSATLVAAELAGLKVLRLINEPTAAALSYGIANLEREEQLIVFDFGGGTLDVSVLEMFDGVMDVIASYGDTQLGGKDIDAILKDRFLTKFYRQYPSAAKVNEKAEADVRRLAERAKKHLSHNTSFSDVLTSLAIVDGSSVDMEVVLSREEFEHALQPVLQRAKEVVKKALGAKKVRPSAIGRVLLVGGSTYIPAVRKMLLEVFGKEPEPTVEPDLAVAQGACIQAALITGQISSEAGIILTDVCPFGLGIQVVGLVGEQYMLVYEPLMKPNTKIPYAVKREYSLLSEDQDAVEVHLFQDHDGKALLPEHAKHTGITGTITDIPPSLFGTPHPLEVVFSYDLDGCAKLSASIPAVNKSVSIEYADSDTRMTSAQKAEAAERFRAMTATSKTGSIESADEQSSPVVDPKRAGRFEAVSAKALEILGEAPADKREMLTNALHGLAEAIERGDEHALEIAGDQLVDIMFELENDL